MVYALAFPHKASDCPAADKDKMDGFGQLLSAENLGPRGVNLLEGYIDNL